MNTTQVGFDAERNGTGTAEWAEVNENICRGCQNDCLYCYAAHNANRFKTRDRSEWAREELTKRAQITSYPARDGVVMFPSSHDITPFNLEAYIRVAKLILAKGNRILVVSKPRMECVTALLAELEPWKQQILFRFTIGSMMPSITSFWEPGAPLPHERLKALWAAKNRGYRTSVSIEPMLEGKNGTTQVVESVREHVTDTIWIGKMNKIRTRVAKEYAETIRIIESLQRDGEIMELYQRYQHDPQIRWKDSIKEVIARLDTLRGIS